jgi:hypothetical protein
MSQQAQVSIWVKPHQLSPQSLSAERCYALHVTGDHTLLKRDAFAGQSCDNGVGDRVGSAIELNRHRLNDVKRTIVSFKFCFLLS